ncbi:hypothetical protein JXM67_14760 [candidate division WOR-3 bacterium]|nr:hypothetical protein [candidate division WOR-3 bacterium]
MNPNEKSSKKAGTRWWTWMVAGIVGAAMVVGFTFRYELFGHASVRAVRQIGWENETGYLKPLIKVQDEVLADTIKAGLDALDSSVYSEAKEHFVSALKLTADSSIKVVISNLLEECVDESSESKESEDI